MNRAQDCSEVLYLDEMQLLNQKIRSTRRSVLESVNAGGGHLGSSLSCLEIIATLYFMKMRHNPSKPNWDDRDRFILSKGHAAPALYAVLAESKYFPKEELSTLRKMGTRLQGHPDLRTPGVDAPSGSLGQGLSIGIGMALAAKMSGKKYKVYVLIGDGECDEGEVWESIMMAGHLQLKNLILIIDRNGWQLDGRTEEIKRKAPLRSKISSFGWDVYTVDGHDPEKILEALGYADESELPTAIIAHTLKCKGISFLEGTNQGHKVRLDADQYLKALKELDGV